MGFNFARMVNWSIAQEHITDAQDSLTRAMSIMRGLEKDSVMYHVTAAAMSGLLDAERFCADRKAACHLLMMAGTIEEELPDGYTCESCGADLEDLVEAAIQNHSGEFDSLESCPECGAQFTVGVDVEYTTTLTFEGGDTDDHSLSD